MQNFKAISSKTKDSKFISFGIRMVLEKGEMIGSSDYKLFTEIAEKFHSRVKERLVEEQIILVGFPGIIISRKSGEENYVVKIAFLPDKEEVVVQTIKDEAEKLELEIDTDI